MHLSGPRSRLSVWRHLGPGSLVPRQRTNDHVHIAVAKHLRGGIGAPMTGDGAGETIHHVEPKFLVSPLAALKAQLDAHFHVGVQEFDCVIGLGVEVMRLDARSELDLFHGAAGPSALGVFAALGLLVKKFAVFGDAADRRHGVGHGLDEVEASGLREAEGIVERHDAQLVLRLVNDPHFAGANFAIATVFWLARLKGAEGAAQCILP